MATLDARQIQKISTVPGAVPTVAPSNNHLDGSWSVNNIYEGELFVNVADQKTYIRYGASIVEIGAGGIALTDLSAVNGITYDNSIGQFKLGGTLIEDTAIDGDSGTYSFSLNNLNNFNASASNNFNLTANNSLYLTANDATITANSGDIYIQTISSTKIEFRINGIPSGSWTSSGYLRVENLNGTGDKYIGADINGDLKVMATPITYIANVGAVGSGIFKDITSGTANFRKLVNAAGVGVAIVGDTIELTNQHTAIVDMTDTFFGTLSANDFIVYDGASWVNSQIKTINSNSLLGSGNIQVGDVLLGGNTAGANMTIGNNSNFNLQLETNNITRQTIDNDGLITFNGTSGNAGIVRMRNLQILSTDGVTWLNAIDAFNTTSLKLNSSLVPATNNTLALGASGTNYASVFTMQVLCSSTLLVRSTGVLTLGTLDATTSSSGIVEQTGNTTGTTASTGSGALFLSTGNVTNAGALASQFSSSVRIDSGTVAGSATRGGLSIFNGNVEPTWNGLQRGIFVGNATAVPTGNPTSGYYNYSNAGVPTFRNASGNIVKLETRPAVTTTQGIADALANLGFLASSTISLLTSDPTKQTVQTTNATATSIITATGVVSGTHNYKCYITAEDNPYTRSLGAELYFVIRSDGTTATLIGTRSIDRKSTFINSVTINVVASGSGFLIQVVGLAATTIDWKATLVEMYN